MRDKGDYWLITLELRPGIYEFKFVVNYGAWVHYAPELLRYIKVCGAKIVKGQDAPGGPNFRLIVPPNEEPKEQPC